MITSRARTLAIAAGARRLGTALDRVLVFELWARRVTAAVFIVVGAYETVRSFVI